MKSNHVCSMCEFVPDISVGSQTLEEHTRHVHKDITKKSVPSDTYGTSAFNSEHEGDLLMRSRPN